MVELTEREGGATEEYINNLTKLEEKAASLLDQGDGTSSLSDA
jgi:hypothetical protein